MIIQIISAVVLMIAPPALAVDVPQTFTLDGQLFSDVGGATPLVDGAIQMKIQILDEDRVCILYEETQSVNTAFSKGYFSVQVGSATSDVKRGANDSNNSMSSIFQNLNNVNGKKVSDQTSCTVVATGGKRRFVRVAITPSTMSAGTRVLSPDLTVDSVPNAVVAERAESLQGLRSTDVLKVNTAAGAALSQTNLESLFTSVTRFNSLSALVDGTSSNYVKVSGSGAQLPAITGAPSSPTQGSIWLDTSDQKLKYRTGVGTTEILSTSTSAGTVTSVGLTAPAELSVAGAPVTSSGTIALSWANQTTNKVFAAPDGSTGAPSFRALTANDIPSLAWSKLTGGGSAGGDLSGTYPNPSVAKLQGVAVSATTPTAGQVMKLVSSTWTPSNFSIGDLLTAAGAQQFSGSSSCTAKQTLTWSALTDTFACTDIAGLDASTITTGTINAARLPAGTSSQWTTTGSNIYYNTGNVGVGNTNPTSKLHVTGVMALEGGTVSWTFTPSAGSVNFGYFATSLSMSNEGIKVYNAYGPAAVPFSVTGIASQTADLAQFKNVGGTVLTTINASGNVGVGTASPSSALDVNGAVTAQGMGTAPGVSSAGTGRIYYDTSANKFKVSQNGGAYADLVSAGGSSQWTTTGSDIYYTTGKVGVGTATPSYPLSVNGILGVGSGILNFASNNSVNIGTSNTVSYNNSFAVGRSNNTGMTDTSIAVGISNSAAADMGIAIGYANTAGAFNATAIGASVNNSVANSVQIGPSNTAKMTILSSGNVGIGTTAPPNALTVTGAANITTNLAIGTSAAPNYGLEVRRNTIYMADVSGGNPYFYASGTNMTFGGSSGSSSKIGVAGNAAIGAGYIGSAAPANGLIVQGNMGVGTSSPQTTFQVGGVISPATDNTYTLGNATYRFTEVYATNGVINTSDRREKKDIYDTDLGLDFINTLRPVSYRWNTGMDNDIHYGLIAQEAEQAVTDARGDGQKTSIVTHDEKTDKYGVRYSELISPLIKAVQELYSRFVEQDAEIQKLKAENAAIKSYLCSKDPTAPICK